MRSFPFHKPGGGCDSCNNSKAWGTTQPEPQDRGTSLPVRLIHQTSQVTATSRQKRCCKCHIHGGGMCHLFHKDFTAAWPTYTRGLWICLYDQGDHWWMVPKCMTVYRSHECQWGISGICQHQFCLLEQKSTRESFPSHQQAMRRRPGLGFSVCHKWAMAPFLPSLQPGWTSASNQKRFSSYLAMPHVDHGPPSEAVVIWLVKMQANVWICLSFSALLERWMLLQPLPTIPTSLNCCRAKGYDSD